MGDGQDPLRVAAPADPEGALLQAGLQPRPWSAAPGTVFGVHSHARTKRLFVTRGQIDFDGVLLHAGEGIIIPAGREHSAIAGGDGVDCVEAFE